MLHETARVTSAVPARSNGPAGTRGPTLREFRLGGCTVDGTRGCVERDGGVTHVEPRVMDVLVALVRSGGRTLSRDALIAAAWGHPHVSDEALSRCVSLIRQALGDDRRKPRFIETVPKRGYRLLVPAEATIAPPTHLAVLPFVNLSGNPRHRRLADGITELLITHVATLPSLRVVSRTSSMLYRGSRLRLPDIARELDVTRIVEGSVLASDRNIQAVMQLIDPATDTHLLARSYMRARADALQLQNELAASMASAIASSIAS